MTKRRIAASLVSAALALAGLAVPVCPQNRDAKPPLAPGGPIGVTLIAPELAKLNTAGFAVIPARALIDAQSEARLLAHVDQNDAWKVIRDQTANRWQVTEPQGRINNFGAAPDGRGGLKGFLENLGAGLKAALPGEALELKDAELRFLYHEKPLASDPHIDDFYLTATVAFRGPGTHVYQLDGERVDELRAPQGSVVVISNREREMATGIPATVHATPQNEVDERVLLLARYGRLDYAPTLEQRLANEAVNSRREELVSRHLLRQRKKR